MSDSARPAGYASPDTEAGVQRLREWRHQRHGVHSPRRCVYQGCGDRATASGGMVCADHDFAVRGPDSVPLCALQGVTYCVSPRLWVTARGAVAARVDRVSDRGPDKPSIVVCWRDGWVEDRETKGLGVADLPGEVRARLEEVLRRVEARAA